MKRQSIDVDDEVVDGASQNLSLLKKGQQQEQGGTTKSRSQKGGVQVLPSNVGIETPLDNDVLSGRGGGTNLHPGNRAYRDLIYQYRYNYNSASKTEKPHVARSIVQIIRNEGGRFLRKDKDGLYYEIGDESAREKTSQALRHRTFEMRSFEQKEKERLQSSAQQMQLLQSQQPQQQQLRQSPMLGKLQQQLPQHLAGAWGDASAAAASRLFATNSAASNSLALQAQLPNQFFQQGNIPRHTTAAANAAVGGGATADSQRVSGLLSSVDLLRLQQQQQNEHQLKAQTAATADASGVDSLKSSVVGNATNQANHNLSTAACDLVCQNRTGHGNLLSWQQSITRNMSTSDGTELRKLSLPMSKDSTGGGSSSSAVASSKQSFANDLLFGGANAAKQDQQQRFQLQQQQGESSPFSSKFTPQTQAASANSRASDLMDLLQQQQQQQQLQKKDDSIGVLQQELSLLQQQQQRQFALLQQRQQQQLQQQLADETNEGLGGNNQGLGSFGGLFPMVPPFSNNMNSNGAMRQSNLSTSATTPQALLQQQQQPLLNQDHSSLITGVGMGGSSASSQALLNLWRQSNLTSGGGTLSNRNNCST